MSKRKSCAADHMQLDVMVALYLAFLLRRTSMTLAANHQRRALLAVIAGGAAVVGIAVLTAGSLASTSRPRTDITPTFGNFTMQFVEPAAFTIVPSPVIETNPQFYFGAGDGSAGYYAEAPAR
jgi:hypothetical protein